MGPPIKSIFCGFEITLERDSDADGVIARAVHPKGTVFCNHGENLREARRKIRAAIRSSEFHPQHSLRRAWPQPLMKLYKQALLFLDDQSAVYDRYWAAGIVKAMDKCFPVLPEATNENEAPRPDTKHRVGKEKRPCNHSAEQLVLKLGSDRLAERGALRDPTERLSLNRPERAVSMEIGQRVLLVSTVWSSRNRIMIESGTWGKVAAVGGTIKVKWMLPYFRKHLWDRFRPDEYLDYFEEE